MKSSNWSGFPMLPKEFIRFLPEEGFLLATLSTQDYKRQGCKKPCLNGNYCILQICVRVGIPGVVPPAELEQYLQSVPKVTDAAVIPFSNIVHRGEGGESSFSVACPSLGLITYCKPIGCYGDILLHSSSSTLNTRSSLCRPFFLQDKKQLGDLNFIYCIHHLIPIPSSSEFCGQTD
ncbi:hypothetical protein Tco_1446816 [Tanacetum coccineum]